jgi:hypothetical protein
VEERICLPFHRVHITILTSSHHSFGSCLSRSATRRVLVSYDTWRWPVAWGTWSRTGAYRASPELDPPGNPDLGRIWHSPLLWAPSWGSTSLECATRRKRKCETLDRYKAENLGIDIDWLQPSSGRGARTHGSFQRNAGSRDSCDVIWEGVRCSLPPDWPLQTIFKWTHKAAYRNLQSFGNIAFLSRLLA